ncbi:unnamed protein product [Blepharisma stoltei]|uniref:Uncharacterized protein n=1 Tax=Blepharisma stoltei TaxID=1481888 RepID=A0AAU9IMB8_9CILI|nr:unnamed protein product [Blepharisma stoltei]
MEYLHTFKVENITEVQTLTAVFLEASIHSFYTPEVLPLKLSPTILYLVSTLNVQHIDIITIQYLSQEFLIEKETKP